MTQNPKTSLLLLFLIPLFFCCSVPHRKLNNGEGNSVPKENYAWANRESFDEAIYTQIDPDYFYELAGEYHSDSDFKKTRSIGYETLWKFTLQFYPGGKVRRFASKYAGPNPETTGNRGILYRTGNKIRLDIMEGISDNRIAVNTYKVKTSGDKLYVLQTTYAPVCFVYTKSGKVPDDYRGYKAEW